MLTKRFLFETGVLFAVAGFLIVFGLIQVDRTSPLPADKFYTIGGVGLGLMVIALAMVLVSNRKPAEAPPTPRAIYVCTRLLVGIGLILIGAYGHVQSLVGMGAGVVLVIGTFEIIPPALSRKQ